MLITQTTNLESNNNIFFMRISLSMRMFKVYLTKKLRKPFLFNTRMQLLL